MACNTYLFDFQDFIQELREKWHEQIKEGSRKEEYLSILDSITEDTKFEDLPVYKDYISRFDVVGTFKYAEIIGMKVPSDLEDDFDYTLLLQLVAASFSSDYELKLDLESQFVDLIITVKSGDQSVTKELQELWSFQIIRLFEIYIDEQLNLEGSRFESENDKAALELERELRFLNYRRMITGLKIQRENHLQNHQEKNNVDAELDELLNS